MFGREAWHYFASIAIYGYNFMLANMTLYSFKRMRATTTAPIVK